MGRLSTMAPAIGSLAPRLKVPPKVADPFYLSAEWRQFIDEVKVERGFKCEDFGPHNGRLVGDHVREIRDGGALLDRSNIMLRCEACHRRKTAKARAARARGQADVVEAGGRSKVGGL